MNVTDKKLFEIDNLIILSRTLIGTSWAILIFACIMRPVSPGIFFAITDYCLDWIYP